MIDVEPIVRNELNRIYPEPDVEPDWDGALVAAGLGQPRRIARLWRQRNVRLVALAVLGLLATVVPAVALSATVREFLGLSPVLAEARLVLEVPAGEGLVARLYTSPSEHGGECKFVDVAPAGSPPQVTRMGAGGCGPPVQALWDGAPITTHMSIGRGTPPAFIDGTVRPELGVARVELKWSTGSEPLAYKDGFFLGVTDMIYNPPAERLPFFVVAYDDGGREVARFKIPSDWLYLDP